MTSDSATAMRLSVASLLALVATTACSAVRDDAPHADPRVAVIARDSSGAMARPVPSAVDSARVRVEAIPADLASTCDWAERTMKEALAVEVKRTDGDFRDDFKRVTRSGCQLTASGTFRTIPGGGNAGPVNVLLDAFGRHGWRFASNYSADGPDGSVQGMRLGDRLCIVRGEWDGGDDSDTLAKPDPDPWYGATVSCVRSAPPDAEADAPETPGLASEARR